MWTLKIGSKRKRELAVFTNFIIHGSSCRICLTSGLTSLTRGKTFCARHQCLSAGCVIPRYDKEQKYCYFHTCVVLDCTSHPCITQYSSIYCLDHLKSDGSVNKIKKEEGVCAFPKCIRKKQVETIDQIQYLFPNAIPVDIIILINEFAIILRDYCGICLRSIEQMEIE